MKILISGAGIAGNALAFWLSKLGHSVTVVERAANLRTNGLQIDLRGHGIEVIRRMGLEQAFRSKAAPEHGLQIVDASGRRRAYFPANKSGKGLQSFTSDFEIMRGDLCLLLHDATGDQTEYIFGTWIESFEEKGGGLEVRFGDGRTDRFDLLVGADGPGSRTRTMMLGSDAADAFYPLHGEYIAYFTIPRPMQEGEEYIATSFIAPGGRAILTRRSNAHQVQVYLSCRTELERLNGIRRGDVEAEKAVFAEIFRGAGWQADEILKALNNANDFHCERLGLVKLESWSRGRVALVGDAAYCPSANTGMGTTCAVVGAYVLAGEIGRYCGGSVGEEDDGGTDTRKGLTEALNAYERTFRPFINQVQKGVLKDASFLDGVLATPFGIGVLNWFLGLASLLRLNVPGWILHEDVQGWDLLGYEELVQERVCK